MPRRALLEKRPWLFASLAAAIAYYLLKDTRFPGLYLLAMEAASLLLLAVYAWLRHPETEARMLAGALTLGGIGVVTVELDVYVGTVLLIAGMALMIGIFWQHRRPELAASQKVTVVALLLLTPVIAWLLAMGDPIQPTAATFGLAVGGTAAAAWASAYPRYRVGSGAALYVASSLVSMASAGPLAGSALGTLLAWPLFYFGHFLICTGVIHSLRKRFPPEITVVH